MIKHTQYREASFPSAALGFAEWPPRDPAPVGPTSTRVTLAGTRPSGFLMARAAVSLRGRLLRLPCARLYIRAAAFTLWLCFSSVCVLFLFGCKHLTRPRGAAQAEPQRDGRLVLAAGPGPQGARGQHQKCHPSLPPPGRPSESPGCEGLEWSGPGPRLPRVGLLPSHPRR